MKKIALIGLILLLTAGHSVSAAGGSSNFKKGVALYKNANYIGCMQTMKQIVSQDPGDVLAHYYLAISYVKLGLGDEAQKEYNKVIKLAPNTQAATLAKQGLEYVGQSSNEQSNMPGQPNKPNTNNMAPAGSQYNMTPMMNNNVLPSINSMPTGETYKRGSVEAKHTVAEEETAPEATSAKTPSQAEIAKAMQTLTQANMTNINPEMMQMNMLMNAMGGGMGANSGMAGMGMGGMNAGFNPMSMMPLFMMNQSGDNKIDPSLMQSYVTNMMMPDMFSMGGNNNNNNSNY